MKKLVVFSNDAILSYYKKQEIKPRYFNPGNFFDEIHIISFAKKEVEEEKVSVLAGSARLKIHSIDNPFSLKSFFLFFLKREKIIELLRQINPDTIRAYNSQLAGYLAAYAGKRLRVPSVLSLHTNLDECRDHKIGQFRRWLHLFISKIFFEPYALSHVDKTICASHFLEAYARKYGARDLKVIYNKVYTQDYETSEDSKEKKGPLKILTVGRLDSPKNQKCIIKAIKDLDVELTLIGDGRNYKSLSNLVRELNIDHKVRFIKAVPNQEICKLYKKSDIFAISSFYEGFCIPVLEAMAASLPVIVNDKEPLPEVLGGTGIVVRNDAKSFNEALKKLICDDKLRLTLGKNARKRAEQLDGKIMERKETELYQELFDKVISERKEL